MNDFRHDPLANFAGNHPGTMVHTSRLQHHVFLFLTLNNHDDAGRENNMQLDGIPYRRRVNHEQEQMLRQKVWSGMCLYATITHTWRMSTACQVPEISSRKPIDTTGKPGI